MGRSKELLEELQLRTEERDVAYGVIESQRKYIKDKAASFVKEKIEAEAAIDVWKRRWHSLDNDFQDLVDDFHTSENEVIKLNIEIESLKANQR